MPKSVSPRTGRSHRNVFDINHFPLDRANRYVIRWDMRIRRSVSRAFAAMVFPAICAGAVLYFGYYAIWGRAAFWRWPIPMRALPCGRSNLPVCAISAIA